MVCLEMVGLPVNQGNIGERVTLLSQLMVDMFSQVPASATSDRDSEAAPSELQEAHPVVDTV